MKSIGNRKYLPLLIVALGGLGWALRKALYVLAVDEKNLLAANHPLELALTALTFGVLAWILAAVWKLDGSPAYGDNFTADLPAAVGHILGAVGILGTMLLNIPVVSGYLGALWVVLGYAAPVCLLLAGFARAQGKKPHFLLHLIPAIFLMFHIVSHYRVWSRNPQFQDYAFDMFAAMALMFYTFYQAAFDAEAGRRRPQLFMGLAAAYLCLTAMAATDYPLLYAGGMGFASTGLCTLYPKPKPEMPKEPEEAGKPEKKGKKKGA